MLGEVGAVLDAGRWHGGVTYVRHMRHAWRQVGEMLVLFMCCS